MKYGNLPLRNVQFLRDIAEHGPLSGADLAKERKAFARATLYRDLNQLAKQGLIKASSGLDEDGQKTLYTVTKSGLEFLNMVADLAGRYPE
ncbi:MAG: hypothetical protein Tsb002_13690 [Wenzhouxiangellaceae bacterium]